MNSETKIYQIPEFTGENIPLKEAARIMGKDYQFVRIGIIEGFLPIGTACRMPGSNSYTFYISPRLFWEYTGYTVLFLLLLPILYHVYRKTEVK